jgi:hypothetical protein
MGQTGYHCLAPTLPRAAHDTRPPGNGGAGTLTRQKGIDMRFNFNLTKRDAENLAVARELNPHIANPTDLLRAALELYTSMSADAPKIDKARREYRKAKNSEATK